MGYENEISKQVQKKMQTNKLGKNEYGIPQFFWKGK
jgi:hypothetical protein